MDRREARRILGELIQERQETSEQIRSLVKKTAALEKLIDGYKALYPDLAPDEPAVAEPSPAVGTPVVSVPRGQEAVRRVLADRPGQWWAIDYILSEMHKRGWLPESTNPAAAIRAALQRLAANPESEIVKGYGASGRVSWAYRPSAVWSGSEDARDEADAQQWAGYEPDQETLDLMRAREEEAAEDS